MFTCLILETHDTIEPMYTTAKRGKKNLTIQISFDIFNNNILQEKNRRISNKSQLELMQITFLE